MKFKFWPWKNGHHRSCMCDECTANIREAAKSIDPWPVPDMGKESFCGPGDRERIIGRRVTVNLENGDTDESVRMKINEAYKQQQEKKMSNEKKKMSRDEAKKAAKDWARMALTDMELKHDELFKKYTVGLHGMTPIAEFRYEPEPDPIKEGVLCVGEYIVGGISTGRSLGVFDFEGLDTFCNNSKSAGSGNIGFNLKNARPVTTADLIAWGWEGPEMVETWTDTCEGCDHYDILASREECKSCKSPRGTNYKKGE